MSLNFVAVKVGSRNCGNVCRSGHILKNRVQKLLYAFVSVCGTAAYRDCRTFAGCFSEHCFHFRYSGFLALEIFHHQLVVQFADFLDKFGTV